MINNLLSKPNMKDIRGFILFFLCVLPHLLFSQEKTSSPKKKYLMITTFDKIEPNKNWMCRDRDFIQEPISGYEEYLSRRKDIIEKYIKQNYGITVIEPNQAVIVWSYLTPGGTGWGCQSQMALGLKVASNLELCKKAMDASYQENHKKYLSSPQIVFQWEGSGAAREKIVDIDGLVCNFIASKDASKNEYIFAQFTNPKPNMIALAIIELSDGTILYEDIPTGRLNKKIDSKSINIRVLFRPNSEPKPQKTYIDKIKEIVKRNITVEDGLIETKKTEALGQMGVRG